MSGDVWWSLVRSGEVGPGCLCLCRLCLCLGWKHDKSARRSSSSIYNVCWSIAVRERKIWEMQNYSNRVAPNIEQWKHSSLVSAQHIKPIFPASPFSIQAPFFPVPSETSGQTSAACSREFPVTKSTERKHLPLIFALEDLWKVCRASTPQPTHLKLYLIQNLFTLFPPCFVSAANCLRGCFLEQSCQTLCCSKSTPQIC